MTGGLSYTTVARLVRDPPALPGHWWLLGMLWVIALAAGLVLWRRGEGFDDLVRGAAALTLVFLLTRAWLAEPNVVLLLPLVLILASLGELDRRLLTALWLIPLAFAVANLSPLQLLWLTFPDAWRASVSRGRRARRRAAAAARGAGRGVAGRRLVDGRRLPAPRAGRRASRRGGRVNAARLGERPRAADRRRARARRARPAAAAYPTRRLQQGLVLFDDGVDLSEEGVGFGVPVLKRGVQTVFPGGAELTVNARGPDWQVTAAYRMDLVERLTARSGGAVRPRIVYAARDSLAAVHRRVPALRRPLTATSNAVRRRLGWRTTFAPTAPVAIVPVTYTVRGGGDGDVVSVAADLTGVPDGAVTEVVLMNELGAAYFDRYEDSSGATLTGAAVGSWDEVDAATASFVSSRRGSGVHARPRARRAPAARQGGRRRPPGLGRVRLLAAARPGRVHVHGARGGAREAPPMSSVLLVYPFFRRSLDRSRFRFPPLGPAYVAASVRRAGHEVRLLDCTFLSRERALRLALAARADVVGVYCMATMREDATWFARAAARPLRAARRRRAAADLRARVVPRRLRRGRARRGRADHGRRPRRARGRRGPGRRARRGRRGGGRRRSRAARRGPSPPTSTPSPSPPATCCPTPPTSATAGGATATPSRR